MAGRSSEEPLQRLGIGGVEGRGAQRVKLAGSPLEALGIPAGEDHLGAFSTGTPRGFQSDAGAATDRDHGLAEERGFTVKGKRGRCSWLLFQAVSSFKFRVSSFKLRFLSFKFQSQFRVSKFKCRCLASYLAS